MKKFIKGATAFLIIIYPLVVYFGLQYFKPKILAVFLCLILLLRFMSRQKINKLADKTQDTLITIIMAVIILITLKLNSLSGLKIYPVAVSFSLLIFFSISLFKPPTAIERIARLKDPELSEEGILYTRNVTQIWCLFFLINGSIALYTTFYTSLSVWALYNGLISYILMGMLFAGEMVYRKYYLYNK